MVRSIRDLALASAQLVSPDGEEAFASSTIPFDAGSSAAPNRKLRVGWMVEPGFRPIDTQRAVTESSFPSGNAHLRILCGPISLDADGAMPILDVLASVSDRDKPDRD